MIKSFRHAGVEKFFLTGNKSGIQPAHAAKLRILLQALNFARAPEHMHQAGWSFHPLSGSMQHLWSVKINANWRLTFSFEGEDAILVDYQDYH
jgi:proteic killer suppression protein